MLLRPMRLVISLNVCGKMLFLREKHFPGNISARPRYSQGFSGYLSYRTIFNWTHVFRSSLVIVIVLIGVASRKRNMWCACRVPGRKAWSFTASGPATRASSAVNPILTSARQRALAPGVSINSSEPRPHTIRDHLCCTFLNEVLQIPPVL